MAKRAAAGTLALAVCLTGGIVSAGAANAAAGFEFDTRIAGADRYETSVEASKAAFPTGASSIVVTNGLSEVDGLTASYVAGLHNAPILYTSGPATVSAAVQAEITRLKPTTVYIVGGETVVSKQLEDAMKAAYGATNVVRYGGSDRYETAAKVAVSGTAKPGKVIVASGVSFADALVAGPVAYKQKYPILLTAATGVPSYTEAALSALAVPTVNVIGGTTVVTAETYTAVGGDKRLAGDTRQGTAVAVAADSIANEGFSAANIALVGNTNANAADALVAAPLAAKNNTPILFVDSNGVPKPTVTYLTTNSPALTGTGYVFGGTSAVSAASVAEATAAATATAVGLGSIAITPTVATSVALANETVAGANTQALADADNRVYTATNLVAGETYRVTLVNSNSIRVDANGGVTFLSSVDANSPSGFSVDPGADVADIVRINNGAPSFAIGTPTTEARSTTATPVNGSITVELDGTDVGSVTPVIYLDGGVGQTVAQGGTSARLETVATAAATFAAPSEAFGLGGSAAFTAAGAASATVAPGAVITSVDKDANTFTAGNTRFSYDANDTFTIGGTAAGVTAFEAALSPGDTFGSTYNADPDLSSSFALTNVTSAVTTAAAGSGVNSNDVTVTATVAASTTQVIVQRAPVAGGTVGTFATIATVAPTSTSFTHADNDLAAGSYQYRIAEVRNGNQVDFGTPSATVTTTTPDSVAPTALDTRIGLNAGNALILEGGDTFTIAASEALGTPVAGDTLRLVDGDGTVVDLVNGATNVANGANTTFALNAGPVTIGGTNYVANTVLTVTVGTYAPATLGTVAGLGIPATITAQVGTSDVAGNALLLSGDVAVDTE